MRKIQYSSVLRMDREYIVKKDKFEELCETLERYSDAPKEIIFFDAKSHSVQKLEYLEEFTECLGNCMPRLHKMGKRVGVDHLCTTGFFEQGEEFIYREAPFLVDANGTVVVGNICPNQEKSREFIRQSYAILARAHPDIVYVDDDIKFHYQILCFCEKCIEKFERRMNIFRQYSLEPTRENLLHLLENPSVQALWLQFNTENIGELYSLIEKEVHLFSPETEMGIMTCVTPFMKGEIEHYTTCIKGNSPTVRVRPGGGLYTDKNIYGVLEKNASISAQILNLPEFVTKIEYEIENFPGQPLQKSRKFMEFEILSNLAIGCTGTAYNVCSFHGTHPLSEYEETWKAMGCIDRFGRKYVGDFGRAPLVGVNVLSGFTDTDDVTRKVKYLNEFIEEYAYLGIPFTWDTNYADVFIITDTLAAKLDDSTIKRAFTKSVFLTGKALEILNKRGFEEFTGFKVIQTFEKDHVEQEAESRFNAYGGKHGVIRDGNQAFYWLPEYEKAYSIVSTTGNVEYINKLKDYSGKEDGFSMAVGYNKFGTKVCVSSYYPMHYGESFSRQHQLREVFKWLSGNLVKSAVCSSHKIILTQRELSEQQYGVTLSNIALDDAKNILVELKNCRDSDLIFYVYRGGALRRQRLQLIRRKDSAVMVIIPCLPSLSVGYFIIKK